MLAFLCVDQLIVRILILPFYISFVGDFGVDFFVYSAKQQISKKLIKYERTHE